MDITLADIIRYIKRKPRFFLIFLGLGFVLAIIYNQSYINKKNVEYIVVTDHLFWESDIVKESRSSLIDQLRINNRYLAFIDTVKLNIDTELTENSGLKKFEVIDISCEKRSEERILVCNNILNAEVIENFVKKNKKILSYIIDDELNKIIKRIQNDPNPEKILEYSGYLENLINNFRSNIRETKHIVMETQINYLLLIFIFFVPVMLYLILLVILFPHIFIANNKK